MPTMITRGAASARAFGLFKAAAGAVTDAYFKYVTMLLPGNGTNGAQNNTFLDSSTNNFSITRNGNTTQGTFTPYGSNWSAYVNGSEVTAGSNAAFAFGTGAYTVELWIFQSLALSAYGAGQGPCFVFCDATGGFGLWNNVSTGITIDTRAGSSILTSSTQLPVNQWNHVVAVRSGTGAGQTSIFLNGTRIANGTDATNYTITGPLKIGGISIGGYYAVGNISNVRIVKGSAVYDPTQSTLTVPTSPLTAVSGTSLLTCQSNRLLDNSSNAFSISYSGSPAPVIQRFSPFSPSAAYSTTTNGGSGYFDGTGDYLNAGSSSNLDNFTGDFCLEAWIYPTTSADQNIIARWTTGTRSYRMYLTATTNYIRIHYNNDTINLDSTTAVKINAWNHVVANRSGSTLTLFLNGVSVSTNTSSATIVASTSTLIGATETADPQSFFYGYIADARIVKGSSVYGTSSFTPPTAPLTAITNTQLLLGMKNAGIIDNAMMNDLETLGNAQISTTQSKFGGSSIYFDGTGDYLNVPATINWVMKGDFTVELWFYMAASVNSCLVDQYFASTGGAGNWQIYVTSGGALQFYYDGSNAINHQTTVPLNQWNHIAATRSGSTIRVFLNGVVGTTTATSTAVVGQNNTLWVGAQHSAGPSLYPNGYMDDVRITNGYARYTTTFTPPSAAFPTS